MWIRLDEAEIQEILQSIRAGPLANKFREPADPDASVFIAAVATNDELEVDEDTVVSRGDDGAFVMSWTWVSNADAGFNNRDDDDEEEETASSLGI